MHKTSQWLVTLLLAFGVMATAYAVELPASYPSSFQNTGAIEVLSTNPDRRSIVISDRSFPLSPNVAVHTPLLPRGGGVSLLRTGQKIGFSITGASPTSKGIVSEVWVFPPGYVLPR